ncbi:hypothetical protein [Halorubellus litoreus]|uniref:Head-to-tail stopper n=1 Tax=Halorubellus litoreus TaxID=755308 RepID=A0ABD5VJ92_9EURY
MRGISTYIKREGEHCDVLRNNGSGKDVLNNPVKDFDRVGETRAIRYYGRRVQRNRQVDTQYGNFEMDTPRFAFPTDAPILDGDRIVYDGAVYELRALLARKTHIESTAKRVE